MRLTLDTGTIADYETFLKVKALPQYRFEGTTAVVPDEYAATLGLANHAGEAVTYKPSKWLFDYQRDITKTAIRKRKFSVFADCGLGKTAILCDLQVEPKPEYLRLGNQHLDRSGLESIYDPLAFFHAR